MVDGDAMASVHPYSDSSAYCWSIDEHITSYLDTQSEPSTDYAGERYDSSGE